MEAAYWHAVRCPPPYETSFTPLTAQIQPRHLEIVHTDIPQLTDPDQVLVKGETHLPFDHKESGVEFVADKMTVSRDFIKKSPILESVAPTIMLPRLVLCK